MASLPAPGQTMRDSWRRLSPLPGGKWLFSQRSWTPIPFMVLLACLSFHESRDSVSWIPGLICLLLGEGLRLWGVAMVGKESRTRGSGVGRLATSGPYRYVRNPLYLGNFFLTLGATFISELLWFIPVVVGFFVVQYVPIVFWEENILAERFGAAYADYCRRVPRWIPRWQTQKLEVAPVFRADYQWRGAFRSERSTFGTLAALLLVMLVKENIRHVPKYLHKHASGISIGMRS